MRSLIYYVATSVDGFIAQSDGTATGFLTEGDHLTDLFTSYPETLPTHLRALLGVKGDNRVFDTVLMGRATYEVGLKEGITSPYEHLQQILFSRTLAPLHETIHLVQEDALAFIKRLKQQKGKAIWLCGGGKLATTLLPEIDEIILKINPFLVGQGIPLFAKTIKGTLLEDLDKKYYPNGFALHHYRLTHQHSG